VRILFYYFYFGHSIFAGHCAHDNAKAVRVCIGTAAAAAGVRRKLWFFCAKQFSRGKQYVAASLAHPRHNIGLRRCMYVYMCFWRLRLYHAHDAKLVNVFPKGLVRHWSACVRVCVRVCVYLITGPKLSSFRRCPNGRLSRVILSRPINKLVSAAECVLQFHVHNGFFSSLRRHGKPARDFWENKHVWCRTRFMCTQWCIYRVHYTYIYSRFAVSSPCITMMISRRVLYDRSCPIILRYYYQVVCGRQRFGSTTVDCTYYTYCHNMSARFVYRYQKSKKIARKRIY